VAADAVTDPAVHVLLRLARLWVRESTSGSDNVSYLDEALAVVEEARRRDDDEGLAVALRFVARHLGWLGRVAEARAASLEDITAARAAGRPDIARNAQTHYAMAAIFDRSPVSETIEWCRGVVASNPDDRVLLMEIARPMAILSAMRGDVEGAEAFLARYSRINEELGPSPATTFALAEATAFVADLEGDHARVERVVRPVFDALRAAGDTNVRASMAGLLAEAAIAAGDVARADEMADDAETVASADDYDAQARWRMVRAQVLARSGAGDAAVALADEAVSIVASTEDANLHGQTLLILAEVLVDTGGSDRDPRPILNDAIELFEAKGCVIRADRARAAIAELR
jgi:tetratricopeptide (TPR) repeat protein